MQYFLIGTETTGAETAIDAVNEVLSTMTAELSASTIVSYLVIGIGASLGLVLLWFGIRKLVRMIMAAFKSGKFKI